MCLKGQLRLRNGCSECIRHGAGVEERGSKWREKQQQERCSGKKWPLCCGHEEDDGRAGSEELLLGDEAAWEKGEKRTLADPERDTCGVMVPGGRDEEAVKSGLVLLCEMWQSGMDQEGTKGISAVTAFLICGM